MANSEVFRIEDGRFGLSLTDPGVTDVCAASIADFAPGDFTCRIQDGALNASPNVGSETTPATWCAPEQTTPTVGETSYSLDMTFLQDPNVVAGLSRFLFENDASEAFWFVGMDGDNPPKAVGKARLVSGTLGGAGRTTLTASISLPVDGKPAVCFGDSAASEAVGNLPIDPTGVTAGTPGSWTPTNATVNSVSAANSFAAALAPGAAWQTGEYVELTDSGASHIYWNGTAFVAGEAP